MIAYVYWKLLQFVSWPLLTFVSLLCEMMDVLIGCSFWTLYCEFSKCILFIKFSFMVVVKCLWLLCLSLSSSALEHMSCLFGYWGRGFGSCWFRMLYHYVKVWHAMMSCYLDETPCSWHDECKNCAENQWLFSFLIMLVSNLGKNTLSETLPSCVGHFSLSSLLVLVLLMMISVEPLFVKLFLTLYDFFFFYSAFLTFFLMHWLVYKMATSML